MEKLSYIAHRRAKFNSISGVVNIPWGTGLEAVDGFIWWGNKCLCATKSETAHLFFAINEDGRGLERGAATVAIINTLAKPGMDHQKRWDKVWADRTAKNNTEVIAKLCHVIDLQNVIIQAQAMELNQLGAVAKLEEIAEARTAYAETMGEEVPT